jgi:hypothetical protein
VIIYGHILEPSALRILFEEVSHKAKYAFGSVLLKAVFGSWLVALIAPGWWRPPRTPSPRSSSSTP